jgi:hypothetical protein
MVSVSAAKSDPPTPRSHALAHAAQQRERERVDRGRARDARHRKRWERRSEEFRLCEQQGLSSPETEEYSSSDEEEEEEDRGQVLHGRWEPAPPPSPEPTPVAEETSPGAGAEAPGTRQFVTEAAGAAEASVRASEAPARAAEHVIRRDRHMVAGGSRRDVEASSSRAAPAGSSGPAVDPG